MVCWLGIMGESTSGKGGRRDWSFIMDRRWLLLECVVGEGGSRGLSFRVTSAKDPFESDCMMKTWFVVGWSFCEGSRSAVNCMELSLMSGGMSDLFK